MVPGRTENQCWSRWNDTLDPGIGQGTERTSKWTEGEDTKLKDAVQTHGSKNWAAISALVPARTKNQFNQRWHDVLDPSILKTNERTGTFKRAPTLEQESPSP
jgi:hypothetical protein